MRPSQAIAHEGVLGVCVSQGRHRLQHLGDRNVFSCAPQTRSQGSFCKKFPLGKLRANRPFRNHLRRRQIAVQQHRRNRQGIRNVVETMSDRIRRQIRFGRQRQIQLQQLANGVGIFGAVESANGDSSWVGLAGVGRFENSPDAFHECGILPATRPGFFLRRHLAILDHPQGGFPELAFLEEGLRIREGVQRHIPLRLLLAVAADAVLIEERPRGLQVRGGNGGICGDPG